MVVVVQHAKNQKKNAAENKDLAWFKQINRREKLCGINNVKKAKKQKVFSAPEFSTSAAAAARITQNKEKTIAIKLYYSNVLNV